MELLRELCIFFFFAVGASTCKSFAEQIYEEATYVKTFLSWIISHVMYRLTLRLQIIIGKQFNRKLRMFNLK
jgi:hypothetical protein